MCIVCAVLIITAGHLTIPVIINTCHSKLFCLDKRSFQEAAAVPPVSKKERLAEAEA